MLDSTVFDLPAEKFVYIYCMLKKAGSKFLQHTSYLTKTAQFGPSFQTIFPFLMTMVALKGEKLPCM